MIPGGPDGGAAGARGGPDAERGTCTGGEPGAGREATETDRSWLAQAIELSRRCPPSQTAFAVGAVIVAADGSVLATGYSRESSPHDHAEEAALAKLAPADPLGGAAGSGLTQGGAAGSGLTQGGAAGSGLTQRGVTLYSSLEPCASRASRPRPCAELIIEAGLCRVVIAWLEPPLFAAGGGAGLLRAAGITVVEIPGLAAEARAVNAAVLGSQHRP